MAFIVVENPDVDIWKDNPELEVISEFSKFKKKEGHDKSNRILKAIYYIYDPKSKLRDSGVSHDKLVKDTTSSIIGNSKFDWSKYQYVVDLYMKYNITKAESLLIKYEEEIEGLNTLMSNWPWDKKDIKDKSFAVAQYKVLFEDLISIKEKVRAETDDTMEMRGGYQKSLVENLANVE